MNILIFGSDSSAHAIAWKLVNSSYVKELVLAPGNGGTNFFAPSIPLTPDDAGTVATFVLNESIDFVVADAPSIAAGLTNELHALPLPVVGSDQQLFALHSSRVSAREWLQRNALPIPRGAVCTTQAQAEKFALALGLPLQIAAASYDGPVITCTDRATVPEAVGECLAASGAEGIVVEEVIPGPMVTASLLTDGDHGLPVPATRIYPQTTGAHHQLKSGTVSDPFGVHSAATPLWSKLDGFLEAQIRQPLLAALRSDGKGARGWISAYCTVSQRGPVVQSLRLAPSGLELAATLPRLTSDLLPLLIGCARGTLAAVEPPQWSEQAVVGVTLRREASTDSAGDIPTTAFESFEPGVLIFHHTTAALLPNNYVPQSGRYGGRAATKTGAAWSSLLGFGAGLPQMPQQAPDTTVAIVVATAPTLAAAREQVYSNLRSSNVPNASYSTDIGMREL